MLAIQTVLHPTDFSESSAFAFRLACSLARDYGARLIVLHVVPPPTAVYLEGVMLPQVEDKSVELLQGQLQQLQSPDPKVPVEHRLIEGDATAEILRVAEETSCDVIVMGTHGRTGLGRLVMGSVAELVVRKAPCPVVTVKAMPVHARRPARAPAEAADVPAAVGKG